MKDINEIIDAINAPFNRSERYFTGTVLSVLLSGNDFKDLKPLVELMAPKLDLSPEYSSHTRNLLFYTEYDLRRSLYATDISPAELENVGGDTPDVVFYIFDKQAVYLFAIEAKMFDSPNYAQLMEQMNGQWVILKELARRCDIPDENIFHYALVPEQYGARFTEHKNIITWQEILAHYEVGGRNQHCLDSLQHALTHFETLVSRAGNGGANNDAVYIGSLIASDHKALGVRYVGCGGGLKGKTFADLLSSGDWKTRSFEVTFAEDRPNRNWFSIEDFLDAIGN